MTTVDTASPPLRPEAPASAHPTHPAERVVTGREWVGFMSMVVGMFMAILDIQIVASSLSEIQAGISAGADEISWVQTAYLIAEVIMIPLSGWLSRLLSTRVLFLASCITFTAMSAACAFAWDINSMILFRAFQGFLGGAMIPTVFATSFTLFPRRIQPQVSVLIGLTATLAPTIGPTLGGWLTQSLSWHWLFLINVAPGLFVMTMVYFFVHGGKPRWEMLANSDLPGIAFVAMFLGCLEYVLEEGPTNDWFGDRTITTVAVFSALGFVLMLWRELTARHPVIDLFAFANRNFLLGCMFSFILGIGLYGSVYVVPLYLGRVKQYDSLEIGVTMMVTGGFQFLSAPLAGMLAKKIDPRLMLGMGLAFFGGGLYLNSGLTSEWGYWDMFLPQAVRGLALMLCFVPINQLALGMLPPEEVHNASGLYNLTRNLGGAIGLAVINTLVIERTQMHTLRLADGLTTARRVVTDQLDGLTAMLEPSLGSAAEASALKLLALRVQTQALVLTFSDILLIMSSLFFLAVLLIPLLHKVKAAGSQAAGH
jgi:DHA2 family multidrug resistance protein